MNFAPKKYQAVLEYLRVGHVGERLSPEVVVDLVDGKLRVVALVGRADGLDGRVDLVHHNLIGWETMMRNYFGSL